MFIWRDTAVRTYFGTAITVFNNYLLPYPHDPLYLSHKNCHIKFARVNGAYVWGVRLLCVTRDMLLTNLALLGGDVALNPGPVPRLQCSKCLKSIRKNQGLVNCIVCTQPYHLRWVDAEFESSKRCIFCNPGPTTTVQGEENSVRIDIKQLSGLAESLKVRGLKFIHQNI